MQNDQAAKPPRIAAFIYCSGSDPSVVLSEAAHELIGRGLKLAGAVQHSNGPCSMELEILPSGRRISISQSLGSGATGCRLDSGALAEAASIVRRSIASSPDLMVFNKFGTQEAAGSGMCDEMAEAVMAGIPVVTAVNESLLEQWTAFTGGEFTVLPCTSASVLDWWTALVETN